MVAPRRTLISTLVAGSLLSAGASPAPAAASCGGATAVAATRTVSPARKAVVCLVNSQRARHGLPALRVNRDLEQAAQRHSLDMVARGYFAHESPSGATVSDRVRRTGYLRGARRWTVGENIGWASRSISSPSDMVQAWMKSPGHRAIILTPTFREAGVGIAMGVPTARGSGATFTMDFGLAAR